MGLGRTSPPASALKEPKLQESGSTLAHLFAVPRVLHFLSILSVQEKKGYLACSHCCFSLSLSLPLCIEIYSYSHISTILTNRHGGVDQPAAYLRYEPRSGVSYDLLAPAMQLTQLGLDARSSDVKSTRASFRFFPL